MALNPVEPKVLAILEGEIKTEAVVVPKAKNKTARKKGGSISLLFPRNTALARNKDTRIGTNSIVYLKIEVSDSKL